MATTTRRPQKATLRSGNPARILSLRVTNYRALKSVALEDITPLTVLLGPNGSGKSTIFDVFNFLSECFQHGLRHAWEQRSRAKELRTRGEQGPVEIEIQYQEGAKQPITYHLAIDEGPKGPVVADEWLRWKRSDGKGRPFDFLKYKFGEGSAVSGDTPEEEKRRVKIPLRSSDIIAVNTLGALKDHPRVAALREFITDWHVSYLSVADTRSQPVTGPQSRLSKTGDNLPNVIQYLNEQHPEVMNHISDVLRRRVPRLESVTAESMRDGRLLLLFKDAPFKEPVLSRFASDGTLKLLAYLTLLYDPDPSQFIGIEEPENFLHPRLLPGLAEECRGATERSQMLVTTHSPFFLTGIKPAELRILHRDLKGHTQVTRASDIRGISEFMAEGASLGDLWLEGHFGVGDPLVNAGAPKVKGQAR
ncbi:MAG: AAA family ATPase [Candidatus Lambdaproteobacteria bacterium]|nr:AAA family ATPase [Candidatus Lambdaproteobacteria bacterium]